MSQTVATPGTPPGGQQYAWYRELTRYHWFVLSVASMGWMFDTMAQQLFNLARKPAIKELLGAGASNAAGRPAGGMGHLDLHDRLGHRRRDLRRPGRPHGPRQDDDHHHPQLHRLHRPERALHQRVGISTSTASCAASAWAGSSRWAWRWWRKWCRTARGPYALGFVQAASAIGNMMAALTGIFVGQMEIAGAIAGGRRGAGNFWPARCPRRWPSSSSRN